MAAESLNSLRKVSHHQAMAGKTCFRSNELTHNNRCTVENDVFYVVCAEVI
jgi:hypothetical protein